MWSGASIGLSIFSDLFRALRLCVARLHVFASRQFSLQRFFRTVAHNKVGEFRARQRACCEFTSSTCQNPVENNGKSGHARWFLLSTWRNLKKRVAHLFGYGSIQYLTIPFLGGWTFMNPSDFDVNRRGTFRAPFGQVSKKRLAWIVGCVEILVSQGQWHLKRLVWLVVLRLFFCVFFVMFHHVPAQHAREPPAKNGFNG